MFNICSRILLHKQRHFFLLPPHTIRMTSQPDWLVVTLILDERYYVAGPLDPSLQRVTQRHQDLKKRFCADVYVIFSVNA